MFTSYYWRHLLSHRASLRRRITLYDTEYSQTRAALCIIMIGDRNGRDFIALVTLVVAQ
jgi:hypothetical protein